MKFSYFLVPLALFVVGGLVSRRWQRAKHREQIAQEIALLIKPLNVRFTGHDEGLEARTRLKRDAAERIRARALRVESGSKTADVLRLAERKQA